MDRILVMRGGALGDFVLGLPALEALREAFPHAKLELVAPAAVLPLAALLVDVSTPLERAEISSLFLDAEQLPKEIVGRFSDLDLVVLWLADAGGSVRRNFQRLGARQVLWAPALPVGGGLHAADYLLSTLGPLGITAAGPPGHVTMGPTCGIEQDGAGALGGTGSPGSPIGAIPVVHLPDAARERARLLWEDLSIAAGRPVVAIHPGSGGSWKQWPPERFAAVVERLLDQGREVLLVQGPADREAVRQLQSALVGWRPRVVGSRSVDVLAALLSRCNCYLGNDSGVTHLVVAVGTPTVAIFGPTDSAVWGPRGRRVAVLQSGRDCCPCSRETAVVCTDRQCLEGVDVEQVVNAVEGMLA